MKVPALTLVFSLLASGINHADEVVSDDLITQGRLCLSQDCVDGEAFALDSIRLKTDNPQISFQDTSSSSSFPRNDWSVGADDNDGATSTNFYIKDTSANLSVLVIEPGEQGGIALGANAQLEANAISVGAIGSERRITHLADGSDDTDAVTMKQFNNFKTSLSTEQLMTPQQEQEINTKIAELNTRLDKLINKIEQL